MFEITPSYSMYQIQGYWAGIRLFTEDVSKTEFQDFLEKLETHLKKRLIKAVSCGTEFVVTELCWDVYDKATGKWREELSRAFKV